MPAAPKIVINPTHQPQPGAKKKRVPILRSYYWPFVFVSVPCSLLCLIFAFVFYNFLPPVVPLFNTLQAASERLADKRLIFLLPAIAIGINFIHALVIYFGRHYDELLLKIFNYLTVYIQILILAVLLRNILVVL